MIRAATTGQPRSRARRRRCWRFVAALQISVGLLAAGAAAPAWAVQRYVSPTGSTTDPTCSQSMPCEIVHGIGTVAQAGDEVLVEPGTYQPGAVIFVTKALASIHGSAGPSNKPQIISSHGTALSDDTASPVQDLIIQDTATNGTALLFGELSQRHRHRHGHGLQRRAHQRRCRIDQPHDPRERDRPRCLRGRRVERA
jgi:hypothetical protein